MRTRLTIAAGLIAIAGWGCGGDDDSGRSAPGEAGARAALLAFSQNFIDKDYDGVCALLTDKAKGEFDDDRPCPEAIKLARGLITDEQLEDLKDKSRTVKITVNGDKATVDSITDDPEDKSNLVRQDGRWVVDADSE